MAERDLWPAFGPVEAFEHAAYGGMFAVDTVAGNQIAMSLGDVRKLLNEQLLQVQYLKMRPELGDLPEAEFAAKVDVLMASGSDRSLESVLRQFAESLERIERAVRASMANYEQVSAQSAQSARGLAAGMPD